MLLPSDKELQWYDRHKKPRPSHEEHGVSDTKENPLSSFIKENYPANPRNWRQQGNILTCDTDFGELAQTIPYSVILIGEDEKGMPTFKTV